MDFHWKVKKKYMNPILSRIEQKHSTGNNTDTDYKAEVIAAGLLEKGVPVEQVCILRQGDLERNFSKDISSIKVEYQLQGTEYLAIFTNRSGFYDNLPERLFHYSSGAPFRKSKEEILEDMERHRMEEKRVREFFRPFEVAINSTLIDIQLVERKIDKKQSNRNFVDMFGVYWPVLKLLPLERAILCMEVITILADVTPTLKFAAEVMALLLDVPVDIRVMKNFAIKVGRRHLPVLGSMKLGVDMILGNTFDDGIGDISIRLGPMSDDKISYYCKSQEGCEILNYLRDMLLPADRISHVKFVSTPEEARWVISNNRTKASQLGVNSFLSSHKTVIR